MRKFDLSLRSSRSSYFATFRHQLTILSKTDALDRKSGSAGMPRSEERFSRNAETDLVCRLLLEKKNWADGVTGLHGMRVAIALMRTPDARSRIEMSRFLAPPVFADHRSDPVNALRDLR